MARKKSGGSRYQGANGSPNQQVLPAFHSDEQLTISTLEAWLWDAVCALRGHTDALQYKHFILPLIFYKRLADIFEEEFATFIDKYGDETLAYEIVEADYKDALAGNRISVISFYIPGEYRWSAFCNHPINGIGHFVNCAMHEVTYRNPILKGVLDLSDYNEGISGIRTLDEDGIAAVIHILSLHRLGINNVEPVKFGEAFESLLRKFAEREGQRAGPFYTPKEVGQLVAALIDPKPYSTIYDAACGTGAFLIRAHQIFDKQNLPEKHKAPRLYGQDLNPLTVAIAKMNLHLHGYSNTRIMLGDTLRNPRFFEEKIGNQKFDYVISDPPWNLDIYDPDFYEHDHWRRFGFGIPPRSTADWGWVQHCFASLNEHGRAAIVLDTGAVSRGTSRFTRERDIRKGFIEADIIEAVILLPENLFYHTSASAILLLLSRKKMPERREQILLIDASAYSVKRRPKHQLVEDGITAITSAYHDWQTLPGLCRVITIEEAIAAGYNLHPSQFVQSYNKIQERTLGSELRMLRQQAKLSEKDLADLIDINIPSLQALESDSSIPNSALLRELIQTYLLRNAFKNNEEEKEAYQVWKYAREAGMKGLFDEKWFRELLIEKEQQKAKPPITIFCCYAREDEIYSNDLEQHLNLLRRQRLINECYYRQVGPGTNIDIDPDPNLTKASLILFLISPHFLASDYIYSKEVRYALEKHKAQEANLLPIILEPTDWAATPLANLQVLPRGAKPVKLWNNRDEVFLDIVRSIRRLCEDLRFIPDSRPKLLQKENRENFSHQQSTLRLFDVFVRTGVPKITFVKIEDFSRLKLSLEEPGRGIVIEGPSGIGKTTAVLMAIEELYDKQAYDTRPVILSARNPDDREKIQTLLQWHTGTVIIDDFHKLAPTVREELSNYLKYLADTDPLSKKLVIVGIPQTGHRLIETAHDIATRIELFKLGLVKDELIQEMIEKGEKALNIQFDRKAEIILAAGGSLNIAQLLCFDICKNNIPSTREQLQVVRCNIDEAVASVINRLSVKFGDTISYLAGMGEYADSTAIILLDELAQSEDGILSLRNLKERKLSLARGIDRFLRDQWIDKLYREHTESVNYLFFDQNAQKLVIEDPQFAFYLRRLSFSSLSKKVGKIPRLAQKKVFIGYSQVDAQWLNRLKVHLKPIERKGIIDFWDDTKIAAGTLWQDEILEAVCTSRVAILLLSADFLASDFISEHVLPRLLSRAESGGTTILPLIVSPCLLNGSGLDAFQPIPTPHNRPLNVLEKGEREQVLVNVAETVQGMLEDNV